jgi:hypothetical protein
MGQKQYDPTKNITTLATIPITGWADGDMITVTYDTPTRTKHVGTGGEYRFTVGKDLSGKITIRLADYSPVNKVLDNIEKIGLAVPLSTVDMTTVAPGNPGDSFFTPELVLEKMPDLTKGAEPKMNEWVYLFGKGVMTRSGAAEV